VLKGGKRLAKEVKHELKAIRSMHPKTPIKFSMCGHSLGGLFVRASLEHIFHPDNTELLKNTTCIGISTICSPHLGELRPPGDLFKNMWNFFVHTYCDVLNGHTGDDLIFKTDALYLLSSRSLLEKFSHVTLVSLAHNDLAVPYPTSACRVVNPHPILSYNEPLQLCGSIGFNLEQYGHLVMNDKRISDVAYDLQPWEEDGEMLKDNYNHSHIPSQLLKGFLESQKNFRRIDLNVGMLYAPMAHDMPLGKGVLNSERPECLAFISLLCQIFCVDHTGCHPLM